MMGDYNVSDHWRDDEPGWVRSLVSSLDRRHCRSNVLPLTVVVEEIVKWVELASGVDAWVSGDNRKSLRFDLDQSVASIGSALRTEVRRPLRLFDAAFSRLASSPRSVLRTPPGSRADAVWVDVIGAAESLLSSLGSDQAVGASWDDLVRTAQDRKLDAREYRPIAELLFDQLRLRGLDADRTFRDLVVMLAFGRSPDDIPMGEKEVPLEERVAGARALAIAPANEEQVVVWLGYQGHAFPQLLAGRVSFFDAHWAVPNARPDGQSFEHKDELWRLVERGSLFKVAAFVHEESDVDSLVRVDLGGTTAARAVVRAVDIVDTILNFSIHNAGGSRPHLAQSAVLQDGEPTQTSFLVSPRETGFSDDRYGASITADAIVRFGSRIADSLTCGEVPRFLAAALEAQTAAERPFGRDMVLRDPSEADIRSVIPLADRVVQHVAAHAAMGPEDVFAVLGGWWPHSRWLGDVRRAVHMCIAPIPGREGAELREELTSQLYSANEQRPFILLVADRATDLLSLCRVESDRRWVERMFRSISDHAEYSALIENYTIERDVLEGRRKRTRNALVHGNPAGFPVIESVRPYAEFLSGWALHAGLESYVDGGVPADALNRGTDEFEAMRTGVDAASYWRTRVVAARSSADS